MTPAWPTEGLAAWVGEWCAGRGLTVRESDPVRAMPWASVVCFELEGSDGPSLVWGKAMAPAMATEIDLLPTLARIVPTGVVAPLAVDREQGFLLLPDGGPTVADVQPGEALPIWESLVVSYARLQHATTPFAGELLAAGARDLRPDLAADMVAELADREDLHRAVLPVAGEHALSDELAGREGRRDVRGEQGLTEDEVARLREFSVPGARAVARLLADAEVPPAIQHDDLSPSNALLDGRWLDWGDASLAHPFGSLLTLLDGSVGRPGGPSHVLALRTLYLGVWEELTGVPLDRLSREADLAVRLAPVGRALAWLRAGPDALELYPGQVTRWLRRLATSDWPS